MSKQPVLRLDQIGKSFGQLEILKDVSLSIPMGERHAIIGPNGAGKTTLFNLISGALAPTSGDMFLRGQKITGLSPDAINRAGLSRSFQITNIFHRMSVFENIRIGVMARRDVRFGLFNRISKMKELNEEAEQLLNTVQLTARRDHASGDLTYSEQRALEIGMTLATGADVILLDEPTAGMSREESSRAVDLIRKVTEGKTLIMVEHDMSVVFNLCDRVSVLVYGAILASDTPDSIRNNRSVQEAYLGEEVAS